MLKKFESFHKPHIDKIVKNGVWIIGIPSGEALNIPYDIMDILYNKKLLFYTTKYVDTGFYAFNDADIFKIKDVVYKTEGIKKDIMIYPNDFDERFLDILENMLRSYKFYVELYCQDDTLGISYKQNYYIEVSITNKSQKFYLSKKYNGSQIDGYGVSNEKMLLDRIDDEISRDGLPF